jgi:hypothetical protein
MVLRLEWAYMIAQYVGGATGHPPRIGTNAQAIAIMKVGDDGKKIPITAYFTDNAFEKPDMPEDHTNFRWLALDPGACR